MNIIFGNCKTLGGGRNRVAREKRAARKARRYPCATACVAAKVENIVEAEVTIPMPPPKVDYKGTWDESIARMALEALAESGLSQKAFAEREGFPASRIPTWRKRIG